MSKRSALRAGEHEVDRTAFAVERYGMMTDEQISEISAWLKDHPSEYKYEIGNETIVGFETFPIIKVNRIGSAIEKILDNAHDAANTILNLRNKYFPKNKQGN